MADLLTNKRARIDQRKISLGAVNLFQLLSECRGRNVVVFWLRCANRWGTRPQDGFHTNVQNVQLFKKTVVFHDYECQRLKMTAVCACVQGTRT